MTDQATEIEQDELQQAREVLEKLEPMVRSEGWALYKRMLENQATSRILSPPRREDGFGAFLAREFEHGEISGLTTAANLAERVIQGAKELIEQGESDE